MCPPYLIYPWLCYYQAYEDEVNLPELLDTLWPKEIDYYFARVGVRGGGDGLPFYDDTEEGYECNGPVGIRKPNGGYLDQHVGSGQTAEPTDCKGIDQRLSLLLYTNIIQQNIYYVSQLQQHTVDAKKPILDTEKIEKTIRDVNRDTASFEMTIRENPRFQTHNIELQIEQLHEPMAALATEDPVKPPQPLAVALATVEGAFLRIMVAILSHCYSRGREKTIRIE